MQLKHRKKVVHDLRVIKADYLIENINLAYDLWKQNPWSRSYSFDNFKEFILPYRNLIEPLENWRSDYQDLAKSIINSSNIEDKNDPVAICTALVNGLNTMSFVQKRIDPSPILSPQQMLFRKEGTCPDLANFSVYLCRAAGLATTFDFTPHYAASSNRHFWNTIIDKNGKHIPFNSNAVNQSDESLPYIYNPNRKRLAKVYRKTFSSQKGALASRLSSNKIPNGFLKDKNIMDVTHEYVPIANLEMNSDFFEENVGFINVYNLSKWKVIGFGKKQNSKMVFKNLGRNLIYLSSYLKANKMSYNTYPHLIDKVGAVKELSPSQHKKTVTLTRANEHKQQNLDYNPLEIFDGEVYRLFLWKNGWKLLGKTISKKGKLTYKNIPMNALFLLLPENSDNFERIFTIEENTNKIFWY